MTVIPKLHILATRGKKSGFFLPFLGTFRPFWRTSLLKWKKVNKMKKLRLIDTYLWCGLRFFFIFGLEVPQKLKKKNDQNK